MTKVTKTDIKNALINCGLEKGDTVIVHSSFKSMGEVEGGAETVIQAFLDVLGEEGTLVFPTFCQKDFDKAYETWHLDKPSDVGYLTNYFRKREGSLRSDHPTHSVAACGKNAKWLTETHGHTHKRFGSMGDTPFSADSPWEKMYNTNAKVLLLGVSGMFVTFRHYAEYVYMEDILKKLEGNEKYDEFKNALWCYEHTGVWPHICNEWVVTQAEKLGMVKNAVCGNATFKCFSSKEFVDLVLKYLYEREQNALWVIKEAWDVDAWNVWLDNYEKIIKEMM